MVPVLPGVGLGGEWSRTMGVAMYRYAGSEVMGVCLLYTSDAADDLLCVDLGGRRTIKNNTTQQRLH